MIASLGKRLNALSERFVPDPFVFALLLTFVTAVLAFAIGEGVAAQPPMQRLTTLADGWYGQFFGNAALMKFTMQMCIVLITGHAIAMSKPVRRVIERVALVARSPAAAAAVVALFASFMSLIQWGLGAIAGAFLAREMGRAFARRGDPIHYPLLGAAGYAGFLVWHGGLSGSAPLSVATPGHFLESEIGVIPITQTLLSPLNIAVTVVMLILVAVVFHALMPRNPDDMVVYDGDLENDDDKSVVADAYLQSAVVRALEGGRWLSTLTGVALLGVALWVFGAQGAAGWNLDSVNLLFLGLGLVLHRSAMSYARAVAAGVQGAAGIILQFPFYFGILGLLKASGLIVQIAAFFVSISTDATLPLFTFLSAGLVNFFVPSGGGQWAVQGPVMIQALQTMPAVDPAKVVMALAYGDAWTNMLQPFWALPLLGIMNLRARDIIGYTAFLMIVTGPVFLLLLAVL